MDDCGFDLELAGSHAAETPLLNRFKKRTLIKCHEGEARSSYVMQWIGDDVSKNDEYAGSKMTVFIKEAKNDRSLHEEYSVITSRLDKLADMEVCPRVLTSLCDEHSKKTMLIYEFHSLTLHEFGIFAGEIIRREDQQARDFATKLMAQMIDILEAIHTAGIFHCNVCPHKIILRHDLKTFMLADLAYAVDAGQDNLNITRLPYINDTYCSLWMSQEKNTKGVRPVDDMESLLYSVLDVCIPGGLPWFMNRRDMLPMKTIFRNVIMRTQDDDKFQDAHEHKVKLQTKNQITDFLDIVPQHFKELLCCCYTSRKENDGAIDYNKFREIIKFSKNGDGMAEYSFDWSENAKKKLKNAERLRELWWNHRMSM